FFGKGGLLVVRAQARFHMGNAGSGVKPCQRRSNRRGGITMNHDMCGPEIFQYRLQAGKDRSGKLIERLPLPQEVEVVMRAEVKEGKHLVQHLAVLCGDTHPWFGLVRMLRQGADHRGYLDGFGPGTKYN